MEEQNLETYRNGHNGHNGYKSSATVRDFMSIVFRRRRLIIGTFLAVFLGAILAVLIIPNKYEAHLKILVKQERKDPLVSTESKGEMIAVQGLTEEDVNSEVELLKSRDLLEKVVVTCGLQNGPESFVTRLLNLGETTDNGQVMKIARAVQRLEKKLEVEPLKKTRIIEVRYQSDDPKMAAKVLETLSNGYLEKHLAVHRPSGVVDFFQRQTDQYRKGLSNAEFQLIGFGRDQGVVNTAMEKEITLRKLSDFDGLLQQTEADKAATDRRIQALGIQEAKTPDRLTTQVKTSDNPYLIQQMKTALLTLDLKRTELLTKFDPSYRLVQEVDIQIAQAREAIAEAEKNPMKEETTDRDATHEWVRTELAKARADKATLEARAVAMGRIVRNYQETARSLNQKDIVQTDLIREAKTAEDNYLLYVRKQEEARISDALDSKRIVNVAIAEAATVPALPSNLRWPLTLVLGFFLAGMLSFGLGLVADYMDPSFRTPDEVEQYLEVPVLATIPRNGH